MTSKEKQKRKIVKFASRYLGADLERHISPRAKKIIVYTVLAAVAIAIGVYFEARRRDIIIDWGIGYKPEAKKETWRWPYQQEESKPVAFLLLTALSGEAHADMSGRDIVEACRARIKNDGSPAHFFLGVRCEDYVEAYLRGRGIPGAPEPFESKVAHQSPRGTAADVLKRVIDGDNGG